MWEKLLNILPRIAGHPLAIMAYVLLLGAWLIWLIKRREAQTFLSAFELLAKDKRPEFAEKAGYRYDDLANLTKKQRYSLLTKRFLLVGFISTLVAILIFVGLLLSFSQKVTKLQGRFDEISERANDLQSRLDEGARSRSHFAVNAATLVGRISSPGNPDVIRDADELNRLVVGLLSDISSEQISSEQEAAINLARATVLNANGSYDDTLRLISEESVSSAAVIPGRLLQRRGDAFYGKLEWAKALDTYRRSLALQPANYSVYFSLANCELQLSNYAEAESAYSSIIDSLESSSSSSPVRVASLNNRGNARVFLNRLDEAMKDFSLAIKLMEDGGDSAESKIELAMALGNRAYTYKQLRVVDRAKEDLSAVRLIISELDPDHDQPINLDDLLSWLNKQVAPLDTPTKGHSKGVVDQSCFMCHLKPN